MGIRIQRNTWRTPLQLIDSWLPPPPVSSTPLRLTVIAQRFAQAGWLGRSSAQPGPSASSTTCHGGPVSEALPCPRRMAVVRVAHDTNGLRDGMRADTRVVLSGRIADVCAELERLAALEPGLSAAHH
jgi:hypothetical protein